MKKCYFILIVSLSLAPVLLLPLPTKADLPISLPFGGVVSHSFPCTCSGTLAIWFTPLYLGGPIVVTGPLVYSPFSTRPYANFRIGFPGAWHLGSYIPGAQACFVITPAGCVPVPTIGVITKVGTN